ncbi:MAG: glycosyltransferase family 4 protein [Thermoleophilia bacterium]
MVEEPTKVNPLVAEVAVVPACSPVCAPARNMGPEPTESAGSFDMKVVLVYRRRREGAYSLEELFHTIAGELHKHVEVIEYETGARWDMLRDVWRLRKMRADIYHVTGDIHYFVPLLPHRNTVLTVHDIGHYLFGLSGIKRWLYKWLWLVFPIRRAGAVTSVSTETRENIVKHLGITDNRVEVVENCHSAIFKSVAKRFAAECPVILQVGAKPYKNVPRLVEALKGLRCRLVLIGSLDDETKQELAECGVDYENHVDLTHEELYKQYVNCDLVSFISLGEGFGVPIIEAQASGRPLITANVSPMREVAGDGACLVDPLDVSQIREGILRIIADPGYRDQLVERGLRNVARYSPAIISGQYLDLYRRITLYSILSRSGEIE